jgi:hypothetical protein
MALAFVTPVTLSPLIVLRRLPYMSTGTRDPSSASLNKLSLVRQKAMKFSIYRDVWWGDKKEHNTIL